jgi:hypothetical protein
MREKREGWREHAPSCGSCRSPSACMLVSEWIKVKLHCHCLTNSKI